MTVRQKQAMWTGLAVAIAAAIAAVFFVVQSRAHRIVVLHLEGVVLEQNSDPRKQVPVPDAQITATSGTFTARATSDAAGLFRMDLRSAVQPQPNITLRFEHSDYQGLELKEVPRGQLYVAYMTAIPRPRPAETRNTPVSHIANVRIRYSAKGGNVVNVGSVVRTFEVVNTGNIPCEPQSPCSPDGRWKAALGTFSLDAEDNNSFRNVRLSCIAGPCPFARVESNRTVDDGRRLQISVLNWSDTVTFLVEAEVAHTMQSEVVRRSYPAIFGRVMSFSLPGTAEGPSVEAELNGTDIVFPLGPNLIMTWATCTMEMAPDQTKLYRCELKPGFEFR